MLAIDLTGKRALVAGVADDAGYGFAIAKSLAEAGAKICVGTWPPALNIFENLLRRGKIDESRKLARGGMLEFERIYPLDAAFDTLADAPEEVRTNKRYTERGDFSIAGLAEALKKDFGEKPLDILVHSLASRAAAAIGMIEEMVKYYSQNSPLTEELTADEVGNTAAFLCSPLGSGITAATIYVDKGYHAMGRTVPEASG